MKKVILLNISRNLNQVQLPMGLAVLINSLKLNNIPVELIDLLTINQEGREKKFLSRITEKPCIYGFSIIIGNNNIKEAEKYAKKLLDINPENIIVYGGPLPSAIPEMLLEKSYCKYVIQGEGEISFPKLIKSISEGEYYPEGISGVYYMRDGKIIGKKNEMIRKLDKFSDVDYSLFDMDFYVNYLKETGQSFEVMASRGCPYNCSFCFKTCGVGVSVRTADSVLNEIEMIIDKYKIKKIYFVDEDFFTIKSFFYDFIKKKQERKMDFTFIIQSRLDSFNKEILKIAKDNGLKGISTACDAVTQDNLDKINKQIDIKEIEKSLDLLKEFDISVYTEFIVGFPLDTIETYKQIINFVKKHNLEKKFKLSYLTPLPATKLWYEVVAKGLIKDQYEYIWNLGDLYWERMINLTNLPDDVLDYYYNKIASIGRRLVDYPKDKKYLTQIRELH